MSLSPFPTARCSKSSLHPFSWSYGISELSPRSKDFPGTWEAVLVARSLDGDVYVAPLGSATERDSPCQFCEGST